MNGCRIETADLYSLIYTANTLLWHGLVRSAAMHLWVMQILYLTNTLNNQTGGILALLLITLSFLSNAAASNFFTQWKTL